MKIIIDAMGGDNAPLEIVAGSQRRQGPAGLELVLVGREGEVRAAAEQCGGLPAGVSVVNATEVIDMHDDPATAFKVKKDSSITVGLNLLKAGEGDAFVSAGQHRGPSSAAPCWSSGSGASAVPPWPPPSPPAGGRAVLIDCGANAECSVEYLVQFAYLGSFHAARVLGIENPRVGLLNIGSEDSKGDQLRRDTYQILKAAGRRGTSTSSATSRQRRP